MLGTKTNDVSNAGSGNTSPLQPEETVNKLLSTQEACGRFIENRIFDELKVGDSAHMTRTLTFDDIALYAVVSGDINPAHMDPEYARGDMFHHIIVQGMWTAGMISALLGTKLPGPGAIYLDQSLQFRAPVSPGDTITASVTVANLEKEKHHVTLDCHACNQDGVEVLRGTALVIAPADKVKRPAAELPEVQLVWRRTLQLQEHAIDAIESHVT